MAVLDWSQCPAVESVPGRLGGAWVFRDTRMPVSAVFENLEAGATVDEISDWFTISKERVIEVVQFAAPSRGRSVARSVDTGWVAGVLCRCAFFLITAFPRHCLPFFAVTM
jgi:uncharacterized protein (DUF433 family)